VATRDLADGVVAVGVPARALGAIGPTVDGPS
jgi:acetyltransferase-like isoleucine patch superfamily enzyme